jgi:hypothetical protein
MGNLWPPSYNSRHSTMKLVREFGLLYDGGLMAEDKPYEIMYVEFPVGSRSGAVFRRTDLSVALHFF